MSRRIILSLLLLLLYSQLWALRLEPMLSKIKVWEYYKYENGDYHNYALVINTLDTDVTLTIIRYHGDYYQPAPAGVMIVCGGFGVATDDSTKWGKMAINVGDTFSYGIKLKGHEKKVIPDFFESIRKQAFSKTLINLYPPPSIEIAVLVNGLYAGNYTIKKITLPEVLPKSGIIQCIRMNSGDQLSLFACLPEDEYRSNKSYDLIIYRFEKDDMDTVEINAMDTSHRISTFFGLPCYKPSALIITPLSAAYIISEERTAKDVMHMKMINETGEIKVAIKTPDTKKIAFTGIDFNYIAERHRQRVNVLIPMNIKL